MADNHPLSLQGDAPLLNIGGDGMLNSFVHSLTGLLQKLDAVKSTIEASTGKMPKVSSQLHSVSQATETATVEILNVLDSIGQNMAQAEASVVRMRSLADPARQDEANVVVGEINGALEQTRMSSMSIAMALQVQDITSQQIAGVLHMIESVRVELAQIVGHFSDTTLPPAPDATAVHFDTNARFVLTGEHQEEADRIIQQWAAGSHGQE